MEKTGKFIVIYGANNLGKTEQVKRLAERLGQKGVNASPLKYPVYDYEPTGPLLDDILRGRKEGTDSAQLQRIFAQNRKDYEPTLIARLREGEWIVAEDYKGTGIAWGLTFGTPLWYLEELNSELLEEDLAICLDGERFTFGIERGHIHEDGDFWEKNREIHLELAAKYGWELVDASQLEREVEEDIWQIVRARLL